MFDHIHPLKLPKTVPAYHCQLLSLLFRFLNKSLTLFRTSHRLMGSQPQILGHISEITSLKKTDSSFFIYCQLSIAFR